MGLIQEDVVAEISSLGLLGTAVASGAAGAFVKELATKGVDWLIQLVNAHNPEVQRQVEQNTRRFLMRLAERVERLEAQLPTSAENPIGTALDEPSTSLLIQKALVTAAATNRDDRHEILAELIAQRLMAHADDMISLVGAVACDLVGAMLPRHVRLLGFLVNFHGIRPTELPSNLQEDAQVDFTVRWWSAHIKPVLPLPQDGAVTPFDYDHLVGLGCISRSFGWASFDNVFPLFPNAKSVYSRAMERMRASEWWPVMEQTWSGGAAQHIPTSTGILIGTLFADSIRGGRTTIPW